MDQPQEETQNVACYRIYAFHTILIGGSGGNFSGPWIYRWGTFRSGSEVVSVRDTSEK